MSKYYQLDLKAASLAAETKLNRKREAKYRKWFVKSVPLSPEEQAAHKYNKWKQIAKTRILNKGHNEAARESIRLHRVHEIRPEARATHLALGYLRGVPYRTIERSCYLDPDWARVWRLVTKYSTLENTEPNRDEFRKWAGHNSVYLGA